MAQQQPPPAPTGGAAPPARIAFVNARAALASMPGYAKAESTYVKEGEAAQTEMRKLQSALDSAVADFEQQQAMLSATNRATRRKELETKNEQLQTRAREIQQRMGQRERELLQPMQERLSAIGLYNGAPDGKFDEETKAALVAYQRRAGITPDAFATVAVLERLRQGR